MKRDVARYATDLLQLKAQIVCQHFSPQTIMAMAAVEQLSPSDLQYVYQFQPGPPQPGPPDPMTGMPSMVPGPPQPVIGPDGKPMPGAAMVLLLGEARIKDPSSDSPNPMRAFRVEINADSLVQLDESAEKEAATEFVATLGKFMELAGMLSQGAPPLVPVMMEAVKWAATKYKVGKNFEGTLDQAIDGLKQAAQQPKPDPAAEAEKAKAEAAKQKAQLDVSVAEKKAQIDGQKMMMELEKDKQQLGIEGQRMNMEGQQIAAEHQNMQIQNSMKNQQMHVQHQMKLKQMKEIPKGKPS